MMNLVNTLPMRVIPIDRDRADYAVSKNRLSDYFVRNPQALKLAMQAEHTARAVRIAAHACGLWFAEWQNPDSRQTVLAVARKDTMPFAAMFEKALNSADVTAALRRNS
ncbi:hypothetical protein [Neisseria chenwenguii]|uniref:Uncharacterized protein n=1 Tax=Neisseria chenwenguii TaxID=1853278 RepID=A0A220S2N1_9NEIS|nr:hypothetical protein [Neisseria chenwenguii]ASK27628.1 hypothetical protein BG910_07620 [Neisseria chenwenguii]ROV54442.1 hypothetical protein EGS38_11225 [Neisseria chenwenguii]